MIRLFKKRVEWRPPLGLFEPAARDAFRVLGLGAGAAQGEVFDAASSLRLALKVGVRKTFEGDAAWLGEVARKESDVRDAVGRLSEPVQRARERLFWFQLPPASTPVSTVAELTAAVEELLKRVPVQPSDSDKAGGWRLADEEAAALHDAALLALAGVVRLDPTLREAGAWARALGLWRRLFGCEEFWSRLVSLDLKGDYEQPVAFGEVAELRRAAPRAVYAHVAGRARDSVVRGELREAVRAFEILRGAGMSATLLREYEEETVGTAEDKLTEELDTAFTWVGGAGFEHKPAAERRNYCNGAWRRFELVRPRLADFARLAGVESFYARRVFEHAAAKLLKLAASFQEAQRPDEALFVCYTARLFAPPESEELPAILEKLRTLGVNEDAGDRSPNGFGGMVMSALTRERTPPKLFKDDPKGGKTLDSFTRKSDAPGCLTSAAFWLLMVGVGVGLRACAGDRPRAPYYMPVNSLPTINVRPTVNLNLNLNYNIPLPLNLSPYTEPTPRGKRKRRATRNDNVPPAAAERASPERE
ncbi:MAG: hypothetical protein JOZ96_01330 [Acidobacteria bacterium]|nr:hypothetical protein [Acidobacteriota bacterium]MBV9923653.1 hypothetical protein [Acidobacteriota bacterium]